MTKILIVRNDNIGDLINTTPAIEALRKHYPDAQIDIVVNSLNRCAIDGNPFVDNILCYQKGKHTKGLLNKLKVIWQKLSLMRQIKKANYDVAILFRADFSPNSAKWCMAKRTIGVKNPNGADIFTDPIALNRNHHEVMFCFDCLAPLGIQYDGEMTRYDSSMELASQYKNYTKYIGFHLSSRKPISRYPFNKFETMINALDTKDIVLTAEPGDFEAAQALADKTGTTFAKTKSFNDAVALLSNCSKIITLDGGIAHACAAHHIPTITLLGVDNYTRWHPWGMEATTIPSPNGRCEDHDPLEIAEKANAL